MKIVKKILYGILIFFVICSGFILLCAVKPEMSEKIANVLHLDEQEEGDVEPADAGDGTEEEGGGIYADGIYPDSTDTGQDTEDGSSEEEAERDADEVPVDTSEPAYVMRPVSAAVQEDWQEEDTQTDPAVSGLRIPANVAGKNGYQPIQENKNEIDDEEAEELQAKLGTGPTGDGLAFDARFYPYYYMLDARGQHVYRQIYANAMALNEKFAPVENIAVNALRNVFAAVYNDHPELFWMDTAYSCKYKSNGECVEIALQYNSTAQHLDEEKASFEEKARAITEEAQKLGSDYEKEKYVHDALIKSVDYAGSASMNQSAYSALVNGRTVCAGYARAMQYMLQRMGIPCYYCTGYAGESHAWNIVQLDDGFYNVDVTWDDTGEGTYDYFNGSDADYAGTHLRQELSVNLPPCNGEKYRNLEPTTQVGTAVEKKDASTEGLRSLSTVGFSEEDALKTLEDYYNDCYLKMLQGGKGNYTFWNVVSGTDLFELVYASYHNTGGYKQGYVDKAMALVGATNYRIDWDIEELEDGYYLISHRVVLQ